MRPSEHVDPLSPASVSAELKDWLTENWDPDLSLVDWRIRLVQSGWATPSWDRRWYGRNLPAWADALVAREIEGFGAPGLPPGPSVGLVAPTIMAHGNADLKERYLQKILTGEERWCQLFSEPGAGSDLAGLTTRADLDGDHWIVNGQKLWNTGAHYAEFGILLARTDWSVPKHQGLTFFVIPMKQEGVEVRPLKQMNFYSSFNEVFMSGARIAADSVVGEIGGGWNVALTTLAHERRFATLGRRRFEGQGRLIAEAKRESERHSATYRWYPQRAGRSDLVVAHAKSRELQTDPVVRQEIARLHALTKVSAWTAQRAAAARLLGRSPGPEGSIGKLAQSAVARQAAKTHSLIAGATGMLCGPEAPFEGKIAEVFISVPAQSIAGGTDEIQRNILGEQVLGLPREPAVDRDVPFRDVARSR